MPEVAATWELCNHGEEAPAVKGGKPVRFAFKSVGDDDWQLCARQRKHPRAEDMTLKLVQETHGAVWDKFVFEFLHHAGQPATGTDVLLCRRRFSSKKAITQIWVVVKDATSPGGLNVFQDQDPDLPFWEQWTWA